MHGTNSHGSIVLYSTKLREVQHKFLLIPKSVFGPAKIFPNRSSFNISCSCSSSCISTHGGSGRGFG